MRLYSGLVERAAEADREWIGWLKRVVMLPRTVSLRWCEFDAAGREGEAVRVVYVGEGVSLPFYLQFRRGARPVEERRVPAWRLAGAVRAARAEAGVVVVELNSLLLGLLPEGRWTARPWVRQRTDLNGERYARRRRGIERSYGQQARRQGYEMRISRRAEDVARFHAEYYGPHLKRRHGEEAFIRSLEQLQRLARAGFLLQVWRGEEWISGAVVTVERGESVKLWAAGRREAEPGRENDGAMPAAYYFLFRWARENGFGSVDFLGTRPHISDGVFRHKSLWGAEPEYDGWHHTVIGLYFDPNGGLPEAWAGHLVEVGGRQVELRTVWGGAGRED